MSKKISLSKKAYTKEVIKKKQEEAAPFKVQRDAKGLAENKAQTKDEFDYQLFKTLGTVDQKCGLALVQQIAGAHPDLNTSNGVEVINRISPLLNGIEPQNELEGMLAVQMVGIHNLSMEMMKRAVSANKTPAQVDSAINRVTKLSRTFVAQIEALNKHRSKGQQKMIVEHVHVSDGGQAVIGNVKQGVGNEK